MVEIRDLQHSELPAYVALFQRTFAQPPWRESWSDAAVRRDLQLVQRHRGSLARVAVVSGEPRGAITGARLRGLGGFYLAQLFVDPEWQGHGIGGQLLTDALETIARHERRWMLLRTRGGSAAESFYRRHGFRRLRLLSWSGDVVLFRRAA